MGEYKSGFTGKRIDELLGMVDQNAFATADHTHETNNTIMWEGAKFMNGDSAVAFNQKVSEQKHGIVLVFSYFEQNEGDDEPTAQEHSWSCHFVPKIMVELNNGGAHTFLMAYNSTLATFGAKHICISDTGMTGFDANSQAVSEATDCGSDIKFSNNKYVLRYVIGV